ncbi:ParB N-terminal domain-containing protein [Streptomyces sp. ASQP_92]|uniref:ParB N-terminal domain-containing protein n=1 Tax=Streptomyces sp. ASQP_92 TaxID=2979116 RepID=UPI0021C154D6|nr:ParB N-terminal domain-containing protein [Streptomyces sp. ASQP_92]MCT9092904.1 ParB N-terminal domain-containing protein [Streptomyces sp. ASQP_92]
MTDQPALRDRIAAAIDDVFARWQAGLGDQRPQDAIRDAVMAILPAPVATDLREQVEVWPLKRVLAEVRCGSQDWSWDEEWADLDKRHAATGYLAKLEQQIRENGITMPVLIGSDGRLWDGHHRLRIAVRLGIGYVPVEITPSRMADEAQQPEEAWPSESQWRVELYDPVAEQWVPFGTLTTKPEAERRLALAVERAPRWRDDGADVRRRIVRTTTTYTVEAEAQQAKGTRR